MQWIMLGVVVVALLFISSRHPKTAFGILAALAVAATVIVFGTREDALRGRLKLPVEDIAIENPVIVPNPDFDDSYQFNARVVNGNDAFALREVVISTTMLDCPANDSAAADCTVVGQADSRINLHIPTGQARDISQNLSFPHARPSGVVRWKFVVTETRS